MRKFITLRFSSFIFPIAWYGIWAPTIHLPCQAVFLPTAMSLDGNKLKNTQMQVLIFKTNISTPREMNRLSPLLDQLAQGGRWSIDLDDCDKVLRLITDSTSIQEVIDYITGAGFHCEELA